MNDKKSNRRTRNWCAVVYPESAPDNWKCILDSLNIKWACSPLHDKDVDDDEQLKKAHWHIVLCYNGNKSYEQVVEDLEPLNCPVPQICRDVRSSVRYFIHKDHPHKFQYNQADIEVFGGFDIGDVFSLSKSEKTQYLIEISLFIREWDFKEYWDLLYYAIDNNTEWVSIIQDNSMYFERLLKSNRHRPRLVNVDSDGIIHDDFSDTDK